MSKVDKNDGVCVVESAIKHELGTHEEIKLYGQLSYTLELMQCNDFKVAKNTINNGLNFGIATPFPHGLPESVGNLFFNVDLNYDVSVRETSECVYNMERYFDVRIKKRKIF
jgi:hypothetical protein